MTTKDPWILLTLVGFLAGCGQKGPLVLPDQQHPHRKVTFPAAPARPKATGAAPDDPGDPGAPGTPTAPAPSSTSPEASSGDPATSDHAPRP